MLYWIMKHIIVGPYVKAVYRAWVRGVENVPTSGPVIIASNHLSVLDSVFMPLEVDRKVTFLAKSEYFTGTGFKGFITKVFMTGIGQIPIDRSGGKASEASLNTALQVLADGGVLAIYPEGTRSPDGKLYRGRTGVARMILESGAPVVPMVMVDTERAMPIGSKLPKVHRVGMVFGEPLDFTRYLGLESDRFALRAVTDEIMYELARLGGQEYVDVYASTVKAPRA
jgi:1-acyl-sn-glycerol-3-phosphate acyltransferase